MSYRGTEALSTRGAKHWTHRMPRRVVRGEEIYCAWLSVSRVRALRALHERGMSVALLARQLDAPYSTVYHAVTRRTWKHVR